MKEWLNDTVLFARYELLLLCVVIYIASKIDYKGLYIIRHIMRIFR